MFGCVAYERIVSKHLKKLDDRSRPLVYFGTEPGSGGARLFNPYENKIIISNNVTYDEKLSWQWKKEIEKGTRTIAAEKENDSGTFKIAWATLINQPHNGTHQPNTNATPSPQHLNESPSVAPSPAAPSPTVDNAILIDTDNNDH